MKPLTAKQRRLQALLGPKPGFVKDGQGRLSYNPFADPNVKHLKASEAQIKLMAATKRLRSLFDIKVLNYKPTIDLSKLVAVDLSDALIKHEARMNNGMNFSPERNTGPKAVLYGEKCMEIAHLLFSSKTTRSGHLTLEEYKKVVENVGLELSPTPRYGEHYPFGRSGVMEMNNEYWYTIWPDKETGCSAPIITSRNGMVVCSFK